ncbi:MAG TPA: DinB family protein [Bacteroidia bacterium]
MISTVQNSLNELKEVIFSMNDDMYTFKCPELGNVSIGEHFRHIYDMYECLLIQYPDNFVDYERRKRDKRIEVNRLFALEQLEKIINGIDLPDKDLEFHHRLNNNDKMVFKTNYIRELLYNLEHGIHHEALIRVALRHFRSVDVPINFGVAPSTINYRKNNQNEQNI